MPSLRGISIYRLLNKVSHPKVPLLSSGRSGGKWQLKGKSTYHAATNKRVVIVLLNV